MPADAPDPADATRFLASKTRASIAGRGAAQVWAEVTALAQSPGVLDLGQGWPDFGASEVARRAAADAIVDSPDPSANQYSVVPGRPELRSAIERYYRSTGTREPGEVLVTTSATEAIYVAIQALCDPGDEIVFLEPFFPWYISHVRAHGGVPVAVPMARDPPTPTTAASASAWTSTPSAPRSAQRRKRSSTTARTIPPARCSPPKRLPPSRVCARSATSSASPTRCTSVASSATRPSRAWRTLRACASVP